MTGTRRTTGARQTGAHGVARATFGRRVFARRLALAISGLFLTFAMLAGLVHANARYFYCDAMGLLEADPCVAAGIGPSHAPSASPTTPSRELGERPFDCCERLTLPPMPAGAMHAPRSAPPPAIVAILPPRSHATRDRIRAQHGRPNACFRARPPDAGEQRARLMVFQT